MQKDALKIILIIFPLLVFSQDEKKLNKKEANAEVKRLTNLLEKIQSEKEELNNKLMIEYEKLLYEMDENNELITKNSELVDELTNIQQELVEERENLNKLKKQLENNNIIITDYKQLINNDSIYIKTLNDSIKDLNLEKLKNNILNDSITKINNTYFSTIKNLEDSLRLYINFNETKLEEKYADIFKLVKKFYSSLELSDEENQKHYVEGNVIFDTSDFEKIIDNNCEYSKERVENLTSDYHSYIWIGLKNILSVKKNKEFTDVIVKALYGIFETGSFENIELIRVKERDGNLKVIEWSDIKLHKMFVSEYDGLEKFTETDFYKRIGQN